MAFFTESFMDSLRNALLRRVVRFQYQRNNGRWYDGEINSKQILGTSVVVYVNVPSFGEADTITGVRVYDNNGNLAGQQSISLVRDSLNSGLLRFNFPLIEQTT
jgi:hypothetical protein